MKFLLNISFNTFTDLTTFDSLTVFFPENSFNIVQKQPPEVFYKKCVLRHFTKLSEKHLCQSLFFNKVADLRLTWIMNYFILTNTHISYYFVYLSQ